MAESRRKTIFVPSRDTGLPGSPQSPPAADVDLESGNPYDLQMQSDGLQHEIQRLQDEIRSLSARRTPKMRSVIKQALSPEFSTDDLADTYGEQLGLPLPTEPMRTSSSGKWRREQSKSSKHKRPDRPTVSERADKGVVSPSVTGKSADASFIASEIMQGGQCKPDKGCATQVSAEGKGDPGDKPPTRDRRPGEAAAAGGKSRRKLLTLEKFDGTSVPLETFLAKFKNCAKYNEWDSDERAIFLKDSLSGNASQVLWEVAEDATDEEIIRLLRNRFGCSNQTERFRAELHGRRRRPGESIQSVYQDIRRLMALGFPGQSGELLEIIGRDAFLESLSDPVLRVRVLDQQPKTLDEALVTVVRMEAYSGDVTTGEDDRPAPKKVRTVLQTPASESEAEQRIRKLEECVEKQKREIQQLRRAAPHCQTPAPVTPQPSQVSGQYIGQANGADGSLAASWQASSMDSVGGWSPYPPDGQRPYCVESPGTWGGVVPPQPSGQYTSYGYGQNAPAVGAQGPNVGNAAPPWPQQQSTSFNPYYRASRGRRGGQRASGNRLPADVCARCLGRGHWRAQCPVPGTGPGPDTRNVNNVQEASEIGRSETYIDIDIKGRNVSALLDTGCERSVCPLRLCKNQKLVPIHTELFAANNTPIKVVGAARVTFKIRGVPAFADVLVSEQIDEFILGYDFLARNRCEWLFGEHRIVIKGVSVPLHSRAAKASVRRIFVREPIMIPADFTVNVPVRMAFVNLSTPPSDWVTEPKEVKPGLLAARTLLTHDDCYAAVAFVNLSGVEQSLRSGHALGLATSCAVRDCKCDNSVVQVDQQPADISAAGAGKCDYENKEVSVSDNIAHSDDTCVKCATVRAEPESGVPPPPVISGDFSHIQPVIDKLPNTLTAEQREQVITLVKRNADVFSRYEYDVGCTDLLTARIVTDNHRPIAEPLRRHARVHLDVIDEAIQRMQDAGIVEEACSPWSANLVVVARTDESGKATTPRVTIDFRGLNSVTHRDKYPLPKIKDCLQALDGAAYLSVFDISNSFYQVPILEEDRDKTAFVTRRGQFRLTRLGQGCTNSPAVFCRLMALVLRGLTCCLAYIDDTLCFSRTFSDHLADLDVVLDRFRQAKLKLKPTKCKLFQESVKFLGHIVSARGIEVDPAKVACIVNWPFPKTISELRGYLGLASYYRSFCPGFARVADPLTECLRRGVALRHTPECQAAFDELKRMLTSAPVLAMPRDDPECIYRVDSDANATAASAILEQWQDGRWRVIEYASRTFNSSERVYCPTRREMAALIFGLKQFKPYLLGRHFQIRVDNMALTFYKQMKDPVGQAARYLDFLSSFDFEIIHRNGASHVNADAVSRIRPCDVNGGEPCRQCNKRMVGQHSVNVVQTRAQRRRADKEVNDQPAQAARESSQGPGMSSVGGDRARKRRRRRRAAAASLETTAPFAWEASLGWSPAKIREMQLNDVNIASALIWAQNGARPPWNEVEFQSPMLRALWQQFDSLIVRDSFVSQVLQPLRPGEPLSTNFAGGNESSLFGTYPR